MAEFTRRTVLANPAKPRKRRPAAATRKRRRLSAAQIAAGFGGKRRRAAAGASHRPVRRRRNPATTTATRKRRARPVGAPRRRRARPRTNPGDIVTLALANPSPARRTTKRTKGTTLTMARKRRHSAAPRRRRRASAPRRRRARTNPVMATHRRRTRRRSMAAAPRRRRRSYARRNPSMRRRRSYRRNPMPGIGGVSGFVKQGLWAIGGAVGSKLLTQAVLGTSNTGFMGYGGNLAAAFALGTGVKMFMRDQSAGNAVILGGVIQTLLRVLIDKTPFGARVQNLGMGDYMAQNFLTPQRLVDGLNSAQIAPPVVQMAPAQAGMSGIYGGSLY